MGKIYDVDLTAGAVSVSDFSEAVARDVLGGFGFNTQLLYKNVRSETDALDPDNVLVMSRGLLTGTAAPSSSRVHVSAKSPLSGFMGSSSAGGGVGVKLRSCGIASIIIRGRAPRPVYIKIDPRGVRIRDAADLWGLDTCQTEARLRAHLSDDKLDTMAIGVAGENLVRYACIMFGGDHAAGRTGLGAVMGSKRLKAITVQGTRRREKMTAETAALVKAYIGKIKASVSRYHDYSTWGSSGDLLEIDQAGMLGTENFRKMQFEGVREIDGRRLADFVTRKTSCHRCPVHCKAEIEIPAGRHKGFRGGRPEYETVIDLGAMCGLADPQELIYLSNLSNMLGLDTVSTGHSIAFAMDLYDRGILTRDDTGGLELTWGNAGAMETLMTQIARREGLGDVLAEGVKRAAATIGRDSSRYAYHVKGVEIYGGDPRGAMGNALSFTVSLRGGDFTSVYAVPEYRYTPERAEKEFGTAAVVDPLVTEGKAAMVRKCMLVCAVIDSLGLCKVPALTIIGDFDLENESALIRTLTGLDLNPQALFMIGERIINLEKLFNLRHGASAAHDSLPARFLEEPMPEGPAKGRRLRDSDLGIMVQDFYHCMGWDNEGVPTAATLAALGCTFPSINRENRRKKK